MPGLKEVTLLGCLLCLGLAQAQIPWRTIPDDWQGVQPPRDWQYSPYYYWEDPPAPFTNLPNWWMPRNDWDNSGGWGGQRGYGMMGQGDWNRGGFDMGHGRGGRGGGDGGWGGYGGRGGGYDGGYGVGPGGYFGGGGDSDRRQGGYGGGMGGHGGGMGGYGGGMGGRGGDGGGRGGGMGGYDGGMGGRGGDGGGRGGGMGGYGGGMGGRGGDGGGRGGDGGGRGGGQGGGGGYGDGQRGGQKDDDNYNSYRVYKEQPCRIVENGTEIWERQCFFSRCNVTKPGMCAGGKPVNITYCSKPALPVLACPRVCAVQGSRGPRQDKEGILCNCTLGPVPTTYQSDRVSLYFCVGPIHYLSDREIQQYHRPSPGDTDPRTCRPRLPARAPTHEEWHEFVSRRDNIVPPSNYD